MFANARLNFRINPYFEKKTPMNSKFHVIPSAGLSVLLMTVVTLPAQSASLTNLADITVEATRVEKSLYEVPASVSTVTQDDIQLGTQQLGLDESLVKSPGIFMSNRYNFSQDLRVSIRGFGARSAFGIRGVRIYVDGIPATLPDGQGGVDSIDLGSTDRIEVIRGPASSLYGSAAGGVINIYTEDGPQEPFVEGRVATGSYGYEKYQVKSGGQEGALNYLVNLSQLKYDGYRDNSETENVLLNSKFTYEIDNTSYLTATLNAVDSPLANDPGGITESAIHDDRKQAYTSNLMREAGESVRQQQAGLLYRKSFGQHHELMLRNYYVWRDFDNALPIDRIVEFDRFFTGGGAQYNYSAPWMGHNNRLILGVDAGVQQDDRRNFGNNNGSKGAMTLEQDEEVTSWGIFAQDEFDITDRWQLTAGLRYDEVEFDVDDKFLTEGGMGPADDSGTLRFDAWSPQVGLLWKYSKAANFFANISRSFETPTTTELVNPTGGGGFNSGLDPQIATNYEIGVKGYLTDRFRYELALFKIDVEDELVQLTNMVVGDYFDNAGESTRKGLEAGLSYQLMPNWQVSVNYTYSDFQYDDYSNASGTFDGNDIPGIPQQMGYLELSYKRPSGCYFAGEVQMVDKVFADDANTASAGGYTVVNLKMGTTITSGETEISPFIGVNNLFDEEYIGNVRLNAFGGRYFEPAPEMNVHAGLSVRF